MLLRLYLQEIRGSTRLSAAEEAELAARVAAGDQSARDRLVNSCLPLVVSIAKRFRGRGVPFLDLIQSGNLGLVEAAQRYRYIPGARFSHYAGYAIRRSIYRSLESGCRTVRVPTKVNRTLNRLEHEPTPYQDVPVNGRIETNNPCVEAGRRVRAGIDTLPRDGADLPDHREPGPCQQASRLELQQSIAQALEQLSPRDAGVVRQRYGLGGERPAGLKQIAQEWGRSTAAVFKCEQRGLAILAEALPRPGLVTA